MAEPPHGRDGGTSTQPQAPAAPNACRQPDDDKMICERCGKAEMYRMHAVWRCPECGFKTDCCGW
jgi:ribosomal protein L37AE/L43A